ncbi:hypothetical protein ES319_D02G170200v1 [Gossypium barbadense]|uniref:Uncharacterized protein n=2 Tax=Gossypium TaxID=3633 RepID=A0A5J5SEB7_GOSBA|nr:hypothetical protein ES319_D02G170200v1 [Gossypium barbadense]TYG80024.1 hypothetical protein ES288_D02G183900v1 [Gossypium darwinii]
MMFITLISDRKLNREGFDRDNNLLAHDGEIAFKFGVGVKRLNKVVITRTLNLKTFERTPIVRLVESSITINGWLHDFLWGQASQVIQSYGSLLSTYDLLFLGAHFEWVFSLTCLFSRHVKVAPTTQPRALSIVQRRVVGVTHYLLGGISTTWAFFLIKG